MRKCCFGIGAAVALGLWTVPALAQPTGVTGYEAIEIQPLPGHSVTAVDGLDDLGRVLAHSNVIPSTPVVWINGETFVIPPPAGYGQPKGGDIGSGGVIVGFATKVGESFPTPVAWVMGEGVFALDLVEGTAFGTARSVDDRRWPNCMIGGRCNGGVDYATIWRGIIASQVGPARSEIDAVNNQGEAVGAAYNQQGVQRPVLWLANGQIIDVGGEPSDARGTASGINNWSEVIGHIPDARRPFRWFNGHTTLLPKLYPCNTVGDAWAINDDGSIAGRDGRPDCGGSYAMIWERRSPLEQDPPDYVPFDLNNHIPLHPDVTLLDAKDINDAGQMAVYGENAEGKDRGYLVTPYLFEMADPQPGRAGRINTIRVTGLQPDQRVVLVWGLRGGAQKIKSDCPGGTLLISDPHVLPAVHADANGVATITMRVPLTARGRSIRMQAIAPIECQISHTVTWTFE